MTTSHPGTMAQHLRRAALLPGGGDLTDGQLLECFVCQREGAAFEALVRRHGPMVLGVCRRLLRDHHDAEDAFQATFLVLARKAASVAPPGMVGNWLYGVACQVARKARAVHARRLARERPLDGVPEPEAPGQGPAGDLRALLDGELAGLPAKYRLPVVLCDLEGRGRAEVARQLGWPEGTLSGRLARARKMLARRLGRHGLHVSGGALALVLSREALSASSVASTVKAATAFAAGGAATGSVSAGVAALAEGVLRAMCASRWKVVAALLLAVGVLGVGAGSVLWRTPATGQVPAPEVAEGKKRAARPAWEYRAVSRPDVEALAPKGSKDRLTGGLNALGARGWELVAVEPGGAVAGGGAGGGPGRRPPRPGGGAGGGGFGGTLPSTYLFKRAK